MSPATSTSSKSPKVPKLSLETTQEDETKTRNVAPLVRSVSQMLPSELLPRNVYATYTARGAPVGRIATPAAQPGATATATFSVRVFITSDLTPHRFCALVIKPGWQWDDFLEAASAKLAGGNHATGMTGQTLAAANAVFLNSGADIGSLDDLREDDQVLLRFQKRMSIVPANIASLAAPSSTSAQADDSESSKPSESTVVSYIPMDGVFRILLPELVDISPLSFSEELIADLVQDELRQLSSLETHDVSKLPEKLSLRMLLRDLLLSSETLPDVILRTYDYLLPHHTFLSILIIHLRAPLVPMEAAQLNTGTNVPVRPQPPTGRAAASSALPTYGMSVSMTDPIRRGAAQTRIVNIVKLWIETRFETIREDLSALELLDDLIVYLCASPDRLRAYGESIARTFKEARRLSNQRERDLELCTQPSFAKEKVAYTRAFEVSPFEMASQLTLADQDFFLRVNLAELQAQQFDLTERNLSPHIIAWVRHSSFITSWVVASILGPPGDPNPGARQRALIIQHFLTAMDELRTMRSYNAMMQIYHALTHPAIERLEATWEMVSPLHLTIKNSVTEMIKPPSAQGYHNLVQVAESPAIPYIEYHLNELRHIETVETIDADGSIHFAKLERLAKAFRTVLRLQQATYNLIPNGGYMSFIRTVEVPAMTTLVELSLSLESDVVLASSGNGTGAASSRIVVRPAARSISDARSASSSGGSSAFSHSMTGGLNASSSNLSGSSSSLPDAKGGRFGSLKERKRKDSSAQKLEKEKVKEEEKRKKKWDKQAKKIRPLLTAALAIEQAMLNNDIYEQFLSYSNENTFINALTFYKAAIEFKRMFGSDAEPAARRTRDEAARIAAAHLLAGSDKIPEFSSAIEAQVKEIEGKAKSDQALFTNNLFDPLTADIHKMLSTSFVLFKAQRTS